MRLLDLKYDAFGLDINDSSIKILKLVKKHNKFLVVSFGSTNLKPGIIEAGAIKDDKALVEAIRLAVDNVKGKKIKTKHVFFSLPEEKSFLQVIQMPRMSLQELKSAVVFEAENYIPLPIDQVYLDFQVIPQKEKLDHIDVLVVATAKETVESYVSCIKAAGLIPLSAEVESQSMVRSLIKNEKTEDPVVLIDLGRDTAGFIVFSGSSVRFTYSIPLPQDKLNAALAKALDISQTEAEKKKIENGLDGFKEEEKTAARKYIDAEEPFFEELLKQIQKYIDFYQEHASHEHLASEGKVKQIILCGGGANLKKLPEFLTKEIGIPTSVADPFTNAILLRNKNKNIDFLPFDTALGLALGAIKIEKENIK